ncbi:fibronectin type III domain-containing protein [Flavobacterium sp.]|uniref:fibronectin type III domain-containing protein n=1 Tax=Flavobacterium sp. TaxID=239 RepID=UPI003267857E
MKKITLLLMFLFISISGYSQLALEGFENTTGPDPDPLTNWTLQGLPWAVFDNSAAAGFTSNVRWDINTTPALVHSGLNAAYANRENIGAGNTSEEYLATPAVQISNNSVLHFYTRMFTSGNQGTIYQIKIALASSNQTDPNSYLLVQQWTEDELITPTSNFNVYTDKTVQLPDLGDGVFVYVAFVKVYTQLDGNLGGDRWLIDDVSIDAACLTPTAVIAATPTSNSVNLTWTNPNGTVTGWEIEAVLASGTPTGIATYTTSASSYVATGLLPNTAYQFYVRAICTTGIPSPWSAVSNTITTTVAPPVCGGNLVDSGGTGANYGNNQNVSLTVDPDVPGNLVTVTFTAFNTEAGADILRIYDGGAGTVGPATLIATLSGTAIPPSYTATSATGQLTFVFTSNATVTAAGYAANITCGPPPACRVPSVVSASAITTTGVTLNWTQPANPDTTVATVFDIIALPAGSPAPNASSVPTANDVTADAGPSYVLNTLASGTCYDVYIRAVCAGNSGWSVVGTRVCTLVAPPVCGGNYVDSGGTGGDYGNNATLTSWICPTTNTDAVTVTFSTFNVAAGDTMTIYDGDTTSATLLGTFSGTTLPPAFTSTAASGCLLFVFTSNATGTAPGWLANVTCAPKATCTPPIALTNNTVLHNSAVLNWVQPANPDASVSTSWGIYYVTCGSPAPTAATTPNATATTAPPFTLTGLQPVTCYNVYVRSACGSTWTGPTTFTTLAAPPECGGNYVDNGGTTANYTANANVTTVICPTNPGDVVTVTFSIFNTEATWDGIYVYNGNSVSAPQIASTNPPGNGPMTIPGAYWGNAIPCPFTSTDASGCLTFVFRSDGSVQNPGFVSSITCAPPPTCAAPTAITANTITYNSVTLNWTQPANPDTTVASSWDVYYVPCGSPAPTAATIPTTTVNTAPPYTLSLPAPLTCYDIYVRANCGTSVSVWPCTPTTVTTAPAPPVCGGTFVDAGGPTAAYGANSNQTTTICPVNPGDVVTVSFTAFNTEANVDALYVYNGNSVVPGNLIPSTNPAGTVPGGLAGGYWGTAIPCSFTSASADGCLTFVFRSNATVQNAGWIANVTCAPPTACATPISLTSTTVTHNSAVLNWTQPANPDTTVATAWDVYYVTCGSPAPTAATSPNASTLIAPPYTLTGLAPATCFDIYVRANCGTSFSAWSCSTTLTTLAAPPECGGNYVDNGGTTANYTANANVTTTICPTNPGDVVTVTFTTFNTEANWDGIYVYNGNSVAAPQIASNNPIGNGPMTIPGAYWGNVIPCPFTSTDASGCLTFVFRSDGSVQNPGFIANITCGPPPACNIPTATVGTNVRHNQVTLNWTQPANADGSFASAWDIYYVACGSPAPTAATVPNASTTTAPPYTLTGLTPLTCYDIYVRANCVSSTSAWTCIPVTITTLAVPPTCNQVFTDAGGTAGPYANNSNLPTYICPTNLGDVVTVTFTSFNTDATNDGLYVYDGNAIGVSQIASTNGAGNVPGGLTGSYWGNLTGGNLPGPFTSTTADGCLTFVFRSNGFTTAAGWVANVTCAPAPTCARPLLIATTSLDQTSATLTWTQPLNPNGSQATAWEVLVLPAGSPAPTGAGIPVTGTSYSVAGLTPGTTYEFYVRAICGPTDASIWSGFTFSTKPINDECANAAFAIVNQNLNCVQTTHGTIVGATGSLPATTCGGAGAANDDVWFTFTATAVTHIISFNNVAPNTMSYAIYSGTCGSLTQVGCNSGANLIPGTVYYIRVFSTSTSPVLTTFDMCIGTLPCTEAPAFCTGQTVTYANATNVPSLGTIGCLGTSPNPAFFFLQVNAAGPLSYLISQVDTGGTPRDVDYVAWGPFTDLNTACSGVPANPLTQTVPIPTPATGCPGTLHACSYSIAPQEIMCIPNAQLCEVYVIMITNFSNLAGTVTFTQTNSGTGGTTACFPLNTFNYPSTYYCQNAANPTPVLAPGATAGVYSSTPGLVIDPATGTIDLLASIPGPYIVTSTSATTIGGTCTTIPFITTTRTVIITAPASATISYPAATYCNSITSTQAVVRTGTAGGTYSSTPAGLLLNAITGEIIPVASSAGVYTVTYTIPAIGGCSVFTTTTQVEILPSPIVIQPNVTACDTFTLPALAVGNYFAAAGGTGTPLDISIPLTSSQPVYIYAVGTNGCITEKSFNVTINSVPTPVLYTVTPSTCTSPTGSITVDSPTSTGNAPPTNLFISEVTDADAGSLTYVEIYNGTGAAVNLSNYKIRTFNNGSATATVGCENVLAGILANNSTYVVSVGSLTNLGGVVPNQVFGGCSGVNIDDTIKLTTLTDTVIDVWGRTDGVAFTPLNQPGYTYRRLNTATVPSTTWNPADWTAIDPEDYTNVGSYSYTISNYQYSLDSGTFQTSPTFANQATGNHILVVRDIVTGCVSAPITILIDAVTPIPTVTGFTYTTPVCQNATPNPLPATFATGFTSGGTYSEYLTTGLVFVNTATGEIDLAASAPGSHTIRYFVPFNPTTCESAGSTDFQIVINAVVNPVLGFSYTTPICKNASATLSPTLASGFTTGGTFSSTTGLSINATTGVIDLAASTAGPYTITYISNPIASSCLLGGTNTANIVINPVITLVTGFDYDTPFCATSGSELPNLDAGFTAGGTFSSTTGLIINPTTGAIDLTSTPGAYTVTYTVNPNVSNCEVAPPGTTQIMIIAPVTIDLTGGCQSINYVLTANGSFNPETATYSWHNAAGAVVGDTQSITVTAIGVYTVTVTVDGCSTDSLPFDVNSVFCIIQKGISVNNDGKNDTFDLTGFDVKKLTIFNRLGMKVYSRNDYVDEWGGKSDDGDELPDGTYYYVIDRNSGDTKTGWIYINRAQ